jgi:hypothetical protein
MEPEVFTAQVADAFNHLYDLVYLRTHSLADFVTPEASVPAKKKACGAGRREAARAGF